jgi:hypothetical protein
MMQNECDGEQKYIHKKSKTRLNSRISQDNTESDNDDGFGEALNEEEGFNANSPAAR